MKLVSLLTGLVVLTCLLPAYFFGHSYLMHEHRIELPLPPFPMVVLWMVAALGLYWRFAYRAATWGELLKFVLYCAVLGALVALGVSAGYWAVVSVYGE